MVYGIIALLALLVDQFLKFWTVSNVALNTGIRPLIPGFLHITYIKNFGAAFGVMSSFGALRWILLILLIAFTALMVFAFIKGYFRTGLTKVLTKIGVDPTFRSRASEGLETENCMGADRTLRFRFRSVNRLHFSRSC